MIDDRFTLLWKKLKICQDPRIDLRRAACIYACICHININTRGHYGVSIPNVHAPTGKSESALLKRC